MARQEGAPSVLDKEGVSLQDAVDEKFKMTDIIKFIDVTKCFDGEKVLDGLTFSIRKGEILSVIGPSGTGKSVALKHIIRLLTPSSGHVEVDGIDVGDCNSEELRQIRRRIGYLFQNGALLAWKTVAENVALPLEECTNLAEDEIERRVMAALESVELSDAAEKYPSELSGGMIKRVGLARAIVRDCEIVLYDEPTSGLDPVTANTIHRFIVKLNKTLKLTSVVVTHDLRAALDFSDRILLLKKGKAVACLPPEEFVKSENSDIQEFIEATGGIK